MSELFTKLSQWARHRLENVSTFHVGRNAERSDAGDTLVEVLLALLVIGLTCVAVLGAFATTLAATVEQRNLANNNAILRSFVETANYEIWLAPSTSAQYVACAWAGQYQSIASGYSIPSSDSLTLTVTQYLPSTSTNGCTSPPSSTDTVPTPPSQPQPQMLKATLTSPTGTDTLSFVVSDPHITNSTNLSPSTAPGGSQIAINGTGFANASQVVFGSTTFVKGTGSGNVFSVNSAGTQITLNAPGGTSTTGTAQVTVETPNGSSQPLTFTYFAVTAINSPAPVGQSTTITGSGFATASQVTFGTTTFTPGTGTGTTFSVNSAGTQITLTVPAGTGTATVSVQVGSYTLNAPLFTYLALNSVSPISGPATTGLTLNGTGFSGASKVTFGTATLTPGTASQTTFSVNSSGQQITFSAPNGQSGNVSITVTNNGYTTTSVTFNETTSAGNQLIITTSPVSGSTSSTPNLGQITVERENGGTLLTNGSLTVTLSSLGAGTGVFGATEFGATATTVTITAGNSTASFWYGNSATGTPTITAAATGFMSGTQQETITTAPAGLGITLASSGSTGTPVITCGTPALTYNCTVTGVGGQGDVAFYVTFWDSSKNLVVYSATQASTITESGHSTGSTTIAANAQSSSPNSLTASCTGSAKTSTLTFGPYTLNISVGP